MNAEEKFKIISEGKHLGISKICKNYGISRTLYYRWLKRYEEKGLSGLGPIKRSNQPSNKINKETEFYVLDLIKSYPDYGPRALSYLLEEAGYRISESGVYNILKRHNLSTKALRLIFKNKRNTANKEALPDFNKIESGQCWFFFTTYYGNFDLIGPVYAYTLYDYKSRIACSRLYSSLSLEYFEDLLTAVAMPVGQTLKFDTKYLCLYGDEPLINNKPKTDQELLMTILEKNNFNLSIHRIHEGEFYKKLQEDQALYTKSCLKHLLRQNYENMDLDSLRFSMQEHLRNYNLHDLQTYESGTFTPVDYHVVLQDQEIILPLWAYIDRPY